MTNPLLSLHNLRCERDDRVLFEGLNCEIHRGEVIQVQGPNGSGKTTLLRIILGLNPEFNGEIRFDGEPIRKRTLLFQQQLLYIGHLPAINRSLSPVENLRWFDDLNGHGDAVNLAQSLKAVGLRGFEDSPGHHLSAGQHRRVALARLYLTKAKLWILDEPFTAIDVQGVDNLRGLMAAHIKKGGTIILTTHQDLAMDQVKVLDLSDFPQLAREVA